MEEKTLTLKFTRDARLVFLLLALTYAYFYHDPGWNGNSRLGLTFAVVKEGRLAIDTFYDQEGTETGDISFYNGHYYTDKAIGSSVVGGVFYLPIYALEQLTGWAPDTGLLKYLLTVLSIGLPGALAGSLMYILCKALTGSAWQALVITLAVQAGTLLLPFNMIFFGHSLAASLLFSAFYLIYRLRAQPGPGEGRQQFIAGLLLGLSLITEYTAAVIVLPLVLYYGFVLFERRSGLRISAFVLPALGGLIPLALLGAYNTAVFGSPLSLGYQHLQDPFFSAAMSEGVMGIGWPQLRVLFYLTVHPAMGLFWQSPVLLLALPGFYYLLRDPRRRPEGLLAAAAFCAYLLLNSGYFLWWGGWSAGPRHLIPMLPFLSLPLACLPRRLFPLLALLSLISIGQMLIVSAGEITIPDEQLQRVEHLGFFEYSTIYTDCLQLLRKGRFVWNVGQQFFGLQGWTSLLPPLLVLGAGVGYFARRAPTSVSQAVL